MTTGVTLAESKTKTKTIYFAGSLFNSKDLIGNKYLAHAIETVSDGRYKCVLPQDLQQMAENTKVIRDNDLINVRDTDGILVNFDGTELDSGTVVEFIAAKFLKKPAVIYRTDFRSAGENITSDPWNLMLSHYPQTQVVNITDLMSLYQNLETQKPSKKLSVLSDQLSGHIACLIVKQLDKVFDEERKSVRNKLEDTKMQDWFNEALGL